MLLKLIEESRRDWLKSIRIVGAWELLLRLHTKNLIDPGEARAIRETIKEMEKEMEEEKKC